MDELLAQMGLPGLAGRPSSSRAARPADQYRRALASQPEVLLLEEATSALDQAWRRSADGSATSGQPRRCPCWVAVP